MNDCHHIVNIFCQPLIFSLCFFFQLFNHIFFKFKQLIMSPFSCFFSCSVWVRRSCKFSNLFQIHCHNLHINFFSAVVCLFNSSLFELLIFMLFLSSVIGDFLSEDFTNLPSCCSLVCLFSLCLASNVELHYVQLYHSFGLLGVSLEFILLEDA